MPIFVYANDSRSYENPVLGGPEAGGWFVSFAEESPPALVLSWPVGVTGAVVERRAEELLANKGIVARIVAGPILGLELFPGESAERSAAVFYLELSAPIPSGQIVSGRAVSPDGDCVVYDFGLVL